MVESLSPLDGKYRSQVTGLTSCFSEKAFCSFRVLAECEYLILLTEQKLMRLRALTSKEKKLLRNLSKLTDEDFALIKQIETKGYKTIRATNHDVKAIEYFIKDKIENTSLADIKEWVHFGLTSEDVNSTAYAVMVGKGLREILIPQLKVLEYRLLDLSKKYASTAMLGRTHGQPASPTTFGKEIRVFRERIAKEVTRLEQNELLLKLNGAAGNYNALLCAFPYVNWIKFTKKYADRIGKASSLKIQANIYTTQIESHDYLISLFDSLRRLNTVLIGFNQDIWRYISDGYLTQIPIEGEVGSSTMPHKINPINFENSEGNLGLANALFDFFRSKLLISRLQRDLSDSTVLRNVGVSFGYCIVAYKSLSDGLLKIKVNEKKLLADLINNPQILSEAYQTILRRDGFALPYEELKKLTRGKELTMSDLTKYIKKLDVPSKTKRDLLKVSITNYIGLAAELCK